MNEQSNCLIHRPDRPGKIRFVIAQLAMSLGPILTIVLKGAILPLLFFERQKNINRRYEMAITPDEIRDRQLKELNKLLDELADRLESKIDRELRETSESHAYTISVLLYYVPDSWINALSQKPSILEDVKQRYIEKGWKDVRFSCLGGKLHEDTGVYYSGSIEVKLVPYPEEVSDFVKVILSVVGILLLFFLIKSC